MALRPITRQTRPPPMNPCGQPYIGPSSFRMCPVGSPHRIFRHGAQARPNTLYPEYNDFCMSSGLRLQRGGLRGAPKNTGTTGAAAKSLGPSCASTFEQTVGFAPRLSVYSIVLDSLHLMVASEFRV